MNQEITNLLKSYEKALNTSDAKAALALYGSDPIVMPQGAPAFIGREDVHNLLINVEAVASRPTGAQKAPYVELFRASNAVGDGH